MSAQVLRIADYERPVRAPRETEESGSVIILPVIRIERRDGLPPEPRKKKR